MFVCWLVPQLVIQTLIKGWIQDSFLIFFNTESEGTVRCFDTFFFFIDLDVKNQAHFVGWYLQVSTI